MAGETPFTLAPVPRANKPRVPTGRASTNPGRSLNAHRGKAWAAPALLPGQQYRVDRDWQVGEVAFLKSRASMSPGEAAALVDSGYLPVGATNHPVLILHRGGSVNTHALVTTISAYGSGPSDDPSRDWVAPWERPLYGDWDRQDWVSVKGSEVCKVPGRCFDPILHLSDSRRQMNKVRGSWLNVQCAWVVPVSVLHGFGDYKLPALKIEAADMANLASLMKARSEHYRRCLADPRLTHESPATSRADQPRRRGWAPPAGERTPATGPCAPTVPRSVPGAAPPAPSRTRRGGKKGGNKSAAGTAN